MNQGRLPLPMRMIKATTAKHKRGSSRKRRPELVLMRTTRKSACLIKLAPKTPVTGTKAYGRSTLLIRMLGLGLRSISAVRERTSLVSKKPKWMQLGWRTRKPLLATLVGLPLYVVAAWEWEEATRQEWRLHVESILVCRTHVMKMCIPPAAMEGSL